MIQDLYHWTLAWAAAPQAVFALFGLAFFEAFIFPIPPDVLLIAMAVADPRSALYFALICSLGNIFGGVAGYGIGKYGGQPVLRKFFKAETIARVEELFNRYDVWAILIAGFTPIPDKIFTVASGAFRISLKTFIFAFSLGKTLRFFLIALLFYFWGASIKFWIEHYFEWISLGFVGVIILCFLGWQWFRSSRKDSGGSLGGSSTLA